MEQIQHAYLSSIGCGLNKQGPPSSYSVATRISFLFFFLQQGPRLTSAKLPYIGRAEVGGLIETVRSRRSSIMLNVRPIIALRKQPPERLVYVSQRLSILYSPSSLDPAPILYMPRECSTLSGGFTRKKDRLAYKILYYIVSLLVRHYII
jgi:hypothetical protein